MKDKIQNDSPTDKNWVKQAFSSAQVESQKIATLDLQLTHKFCKLQVQLVRAYSYSTQTGS